MARRQGMEHASNILEALAASSRPLSAYDLLDRLRPKGISAPLTIYRALDKLIAAGKVHRIESLNAFVACKDSDHSGHIHTHDTSVGFAICDQCGSVDEFIDPHLHDRINADLSSRAFVPRASAIEVHGLCADCNSEKS